MSNPSKKKGTAFEVDVRDRLNARLGPIGVHVSRTALAGSADAGDLSGLRWRGFGIGVSCKACKRLELPRWLREARAQADRAGDLVSVVVHKVPGVGAANMGRQVVSMHLEDFETLLLTGTPTTRAVLEGGQPTCDECGALLRMRRGERYCPQCGCLIVGTSALGGGDE